MRRGGRLLRCQLIYRETERHPRNPIRSTLGRFPVLPELVGFIDLISMDLSLGPSPQIVKLHVINLAEERCHLGSLSPGLVLSGKEKGMSKRPLQAFLPYRGPLWKGTSLGPGRSG